MLRASNLADNDLQAAARANGLCMVIRSPEWRPRDGQVIEGCEITDSKKNSRSKSKRRRKWRNRPRSSPSIREQDEKINISELTTMETKSTEESKHPSPRPGDEDLLKTTDLYAPPKSRSILGRSTRINN